MSYDSEMPLRGVVYTSEPSERAAFVRRTYAHLGGAVLAFIGLEALLLQLLKPEEVFGFFAQSPYAFFILLILAMGGSWVAQYWARSETSRAVQYLGLALFVGVEAIIIFPMLCYASLLAAEHR